MAFFRNPKGSKNQVLNVTLIKVSFSFPQHTPTTRIYYTFDVLTSLYGKSKNPIFIHIVGTLVLTFAEPWGGQYNIIEIYLHGALHYIQKSIQPQNTSFTGIRIKENSFHWTVQLKCWIKISRDEKWLFEENWACPLLGSFQLKITMRYILTHVNCISGIYLFSNELSRPLY